MANTPNVSSAVSLIYPLIKGASPVVVDLAAYTFARKFFSTKTSYAAASLAGAAALIVLCSSTQKQALNSGLLYLAYKVLLLVLNYRSSPAKSKTATDLHTSSSNGSATTPPATGPAPGSSSSNSSGAASSPPPATEPAPGSSSSNGSGGAASSPPPATEPAPESTPSNASGAASSTTTSSAAESASGSSSSNSSGAASSTTSSEAESASVSSSSNGSEAASSPPPAVESASGSSSSASAAAPQSPRREASQPLSNGSGAASSPSPAAESASGSSATASATPPPSSVPAAGPQSPRREASQLPSNGHANTPPPSPLNTFPASSSPSRAALQADLSASSSSSSAAAASAKPRSLEERKAAAEAIKTRFDALGERFTFTFNGRLNIKPESTGAEIQAELYKQSGFTIAELDVRVRSQWSSNTQEFGPLIRDAAKEMIMSLTEIEFATQHIADPEERKKAIAEHLNNDPYFDPLNRTLPYIYRFVRKMRGIIHCPNVEHKLMSVQRKILYPPTLTPPDKEAFYQARTEKNEWREIYNLAIAACTPYLPHLKENLRKWLVQDDGKTNF